MADTERHPVLIEIAETDAGKHLQLADGHARVAKRLIEVARRNQTAELIDFTVRGTLHGAPNLPDLTPILVNVSRVDPLRGLFERVPGSPGKDDGGSCARRRDGDGPADPRAGSDDDHFLPV